MSPSDKHNRMSFSAKQAQKAASMNLDDIDIPSTPLERGESRTAPGQLMNLQGKFAAAEEKIRDLETRMENGASLEIPISKLHEVEGRRRRLTDEQFHELQENLRNNQLVTAITVRKRKAGDGYEIISGHNRVAAYRALGKEKILAVVADTDDEHVDINAFYANLLQPSLPEYEKYLGFKNRLSSTSKSYTEVAAEAGVTSAYVSMLMTFDEMPAEVIVMLNDRPELIGANAASEFVKLVGRGRKKQVLKAIEGIRDGSLTQAAAVREAAHDKPTAQKIAPKKFRSGKTIFAEMRAMDKDIRISFKAVASDEQRQRAKAAIELIIENIASEEKT